MVEENQFRKVLIIGAGPGVIGQGEVYEQAGLEACRTLRQAGIRSVVLGSDPASLVTERVWADQVYIEPLTPEVIEKIIIRERPDGLLISFGGQNALNLGYTLNMSGILEKYHVPLIGFADQLLSRIEERGVFTKLINAAGIKTPAVTAVQEMRDGVNLGKTMGFPLVVRTPLVGEGLGVSLAYNQEELAVLLEKGLSVSPAQTVWLEESLQNWREFEVAALRDKEGTYLVAAVLENIDPVGVHSGDSIVVSPPQGLTGSEIAELTSLTAKVMETLGVVGGAGLQWAWNPQNGEFRLLRLDPRYTRNTSLVAQITGLPLAAIAVRLLIGYTLPQVAGMGGDIPDLPVNGVFQPQHTFAAVRLPRFETAKFPDASPVLNTTMKSTGEVFAIGGNFREALQKAVRSLEIGRQGLGADRPDPEETELSAAVLKTGVVNPGAERLFNLRLSIKRGFAVADLVKQSKLAEWFVREIAQVVRFEKQLSTYALYNLEPEVLLQAKREGFSDGQVAFLLRTSHWEIRQLRLRSGIVPVYRAISPKRFYGSYSPEDGATLPAKGASGAHALLLIGSGPARIGQGPEYDYCAAFAAYGFQESGRSCVYVNSNPQNAVADFAPETVTYVEPLTAEDLLNIIDWEKPAAMLTHFSGVVGAGLTTALRTQGSDWERELTDIARVVPVQYYQQSSTALGIKLPNSAVAATLEEAGRVANQIGFPVVLCPTGESGLAEAVHTAGELPDAWERLGQWVKPPLRMEHLPDNATAFQLIGVADGNALRIAATVEQIEEALVEVGDSACAIPAFTLQPETAVKLSEIAAKLVGEIQPRGLVSFLFAVKQENIYLREFRIGDCRLIPFLQKTGGAAWVQTAVQAVLDQTVASDAAERVDVSQRFAVKEAVFSFENFPGMDAILGPEQRSTGAVVGMDANFSMAFIKSQLGAGENMPFAGNVYLGIRGEDKRTVETLGKQLARIGFGILADMETAEILNRSQIPCQEVPHRGEGRPDILDRMKNGEVHWIINTPRGRKVRREEALIRSTAVARGIPIATTLSGARAAADGIEQYMRHGLEVRPVKEY